MRNLCCLTRRSARAVVVIDFQQRSSAHSSPDIIGRKLRERRSLEQACADLHAEYEKRPSVALARMIEQLKAEIAVR